MSADELALREALVELFPLGLTDDAPARRRARVAKRRADRVAERRAAREAKLREDARRPVDTLVSLSSRPTRRDDSMPDNGAANRRESWADRVEREAREQADQLRTNIAETEATLTSLREEYAKVGAILTAIGAAAPPAPEPPVAAAPTPAAPPEPPALRERETKHRPAALTDEEEAKLRAFAEDSGIFTVKRARELLDPEDNTPGPKKQAVSNFYHAMLADGTIARHGTPGSPYMFYTHRDYDGPVDLAVAKAQGAPAPVAEPPQPEPTPEPEPEPEPDGGALLAALAERGPLSTRDLRAMGIADVKEVADALAERGAVVFEREVRDGHGFPYVRLPDQALPEDAIATPSDATRATRRVEADPTTRRAANAAKQMGIFTIKRLDELLNGDRATNSTRANLSIVMKDLVAAGVARRYGPERGVGVYFTHVDYDGPLDLVIAKGEVSRQALAEEPVAEPEPEPEIAPAPTDMPSELAAMPAATRNGPLAPRIASARDQLKVYNAVARGPSVSGEVAKIAGLPTTRVTAYLRELEEAGLLRRTGVERRGRDQTLGRPGFEFEVAGPAAAPAAPAPAADSPSRSLSRSQQAQRRRRAEAGSRARRGGPLERPYHPGSRRDQARVGPGRGRRAAGRPRPPRHPERRGRGGRARLRLRPAGRPGPRPQRAARQRPRPGGPLRPERQGRDRRGHRARAEGQQPRCAPAGRRGEEAGLQGRPRAERPLADHYARRAEGAHLGHA
jgi:hypothetical protein